LNCARQTRRRVVIQAKLSNDKTRDEGCDIQSMTDKQPKQGRSIGRAKRLNEAKPEVIVDLKLYPTERGGRTSPILPGWGSPCTIQSERGSGWIAYDGWPLLGNNPLKPGDIRRVGYIFLSGKKAVDYLRTAD
jgi:hypothetical protein